jgi:hypothetical protein
MKYLTKAIVIVTPLFFLQGCLSFLSLTAKTSAANEYSQGHKVEDDRTSADFSNSHDGHSMDGMNHQKNLSQTQAKLFTSAKIIANKPVSLTIDIQDSAEKAITKFDTFQEKLMHLIVVSDDLQCFSHLHPQPGKYKLWGQFNRNGKIVVADFWINVL